MQASTIFLVDDDDALRRATQRLLESHGLRVAAFPSAEAFVAAFDSDAPGCLLLDLRMPGVGGLELQQQLVERGVGLPIVFMTGHADVTSSVTAMKVGALDLLQKPVHEDVLVAALQRALARDQETRHTRRERAELERRLARLTPREREIFDEIVAGHLNKQAAYALGIAERTVKLHRARVLEKMGAESVAELARMAERLGLSPRGS